MNTRPNERTFTPHINSTITQFPDHKGDLVYSYTVWCHDWCNAHQKRTGLALSLDELKQKMGEAYASLICVDGTTYGLGSK